MGIMQSLRKKDSRAEGVVAPPRAAEAPQLMMLVPDAQGIATYQLHKFPSARAAEIFVDVTLRGQVNEGTVLFWALTWQPAADSDAEPLVLISDAVKPVVYLFSFANLDSCHEFVRHEMSRGLDIGQVMVYWALPARVEADFWGRAAVAPSAAPQRAFSVVEDSIAIAADPEPDARVVPFTTHDAADDEHRYLTEADIADTIREMNALTARLDAASSPVIDFPSASKKIAKSKKARVGSAAWANFALAIDEALDVYVARQVRIRLSWNRIMRALGEALSAHHRLSAEATWRTAPPAPAEVAKVPSIDHHPSVGRAWTNASIALADAATVAIRRKLMRRVWMNTAWTMEEAVYAHRLEQRARAIRAWNFAAMACAEAVNVRTTHEAAIGRGWHHATASLAQAAVLHERLARVRVGLNFAGLAIEEAIEAKAYHGEIIAAWTAIGEAMNEAAIAHEAYEHHRRIVAGWHNATTAITEAIVAEARLRIAQADKKLVAAVDKAVKSQTAGKPSTSANPSVVEGTQPDVAADAPDADAKDQQQTSAESKPNFSRVRRAWEPHDEPFEGFRSPPGRF